MYILTQYYTQRSPQVSFPKKINDNINSIINQLNSITHIKASFDKDKNAENRSYLIIEKAKNTHVTSEDFAKIKSLMQHNIINKQIADTGRYISFPIKLFFLNNDDPHNPQLESISSIVVLKGFELVEVRKEFFNDTSIVDYKLAVITSEFHTYIRITNSLGRSEFIGLNGHHGESPMGKMLSYAYLRDDSFYDKNYANCESKIKADALSDAGQYGHFIDKGISVTEFAITLPMFQKFKVYINKQILSPLKWWYSFTGTLAENCSIWVQKCFNEIGFKGHFLDLIKMDELDHHDIGIIFNICKNIVHNINDFTSYVVTLRSCLLKTLDYYFKSITGPKGALFEALYDGRTKEALNLMVSHTAEELKELTTSAAEGVIHFIAKLPPSELKILLLETAIRKGLDLKATDYYNSKTALTICAQKNDVDCVNIIIKNDPTTSEYINHNNHKPVNIAASSSNGYDVLALLITPANAYYDANGEFDFPVCILKNANYEMSPELGYDKTRCNETKDQNLNKAIIGWGEGIDMSIPDSRSNLPASIITHAILIPTQVLALVEDVIENHIDL